MEHTPMRAGEDLPESQARATASADGVTLDNGSSVGPTPGPWTIFGPLSSAGVQRCEGDNHPPFTFRNVVIASGDKCLAEVLMWTDGEHGGFPRVDNIAEQDANARLIAAAPQLLTALKDAVARLERCLRYVGSDAEFVASALAPMRAAIATAEGR